MVIGGPKVILLENHLFTNYKLKLTYFLDLSNISLTSLNIMHTSFLELNFYNLDKESLNLMKLKDFKRIYKDIYKLSKYYDSLYVLDMIISSYVLGVDNIIRCELELVTKNNIKTIALNLNNYNYFIVVSVNFDDKMDYF